ncbi:amidohydrolase family protein [Luteolibacter algae]|uniref:Amidohydrolase family protein n=1 Tax=Luteolibacter algae TaxID=454151 RepID=A0ABW5D8N2_9BACT
MIDSHHHLWNYSVEEYDWIPTGSPLAQNQLLPELEAVTAEAGVTGTVVVQARQVIEESDALLELADASDVIKAVVGWVPLIDENVADDLERLSPASKFKGVRHVLQGEPDEYFLRDDFHRGLAKLPDYDLIYDLLIFQRQLPVATQLVDRQPDLPIVLNHLAKPEARDGRIEPAWREGMKELAKRENVIGVKFSALLTEFPEGEGNHETVAAYFQETLEIFGADKVMFGTDWPVCLLRTTYKEWTDSILRLTASLSASDREAIFKGNATRCYNIG